MPVCPNCGHHLMRMHRSAAQKIVYADAFRCSRCHFRTRRLRTALSVSLAFYFSRFTHCIRCGSSRIERLKKRDRIDSTSKHPTSLLLRLTGAPLKKCPACRLQYYDWRPPVPDVRQE
jgi:hypothetical protein